MKKRVECTCRVLNVTLGIFVIGTLLSGCFAIKESMHRAASLSSTDRDKSTLKGQALPERRSRPLFIAEGSRSAPTACEGESSAKTELLARYIAQLQGGKAVQKENCFAQGQDQALRTSLLRGSCLGTGCGVYDVYRRGPLWFSLFMASFNAALAQSSVKIYESALSGDEQGLSIVARPSMFKSEGYKNTQRQVVRFKLDDEIDCIAQLKLYRDHVTLERIDGLDLVNQRFAITNAPSAGTLFAEHRAKKHSVGYEVLIIERRIAKERGGGEVLERELLCQRRSGPVNLFESGLHFSWTHEDRDTARVYAHPKSEAGGLKER